MTVSKRRYKGRSGRRGITAVEALAALVVLHIAAIVMFQLVSLLAQSNRHIGAQTEALEIGSRLASELSDAKFVGPAAEDRDPHLAFGVYNETVARDQLSTIQTFGLFNPIVSGPVEEVANPAYSVIYEVIPCADCGALGGAEILITVDNYAMNGPLRRPVHLALRRTYLNAMAARDELRGW